MDAAGAGLAHDEAAALADKIVVIIPAFDEGGCVAAVVRAVPAACCGLPVVTLVVDDGSADDTAAQASSAGAIVLRHPANRGGGAALQTGYRAALDGGAKLIATLDADGQHLPAELPRFVAPLLAGEADLVVGSRILGRAQGGALSRRVGIWVFNTQVSLLTGQRVTDCSNGFRAMTPAVLRQVELHQAQFHAAEFLVEALTRGLRTLEVPVTVVERQAGLTKKPPTLRYGWGFSQAIMQAWLRARRRERASRRTGHTPASREPAPADRPLG